MDTGRTRSTHVTKSNMAARAGLVEYWVMFASLGAVCSVLVDLLAVAANWIEDPCKWNHLQVLQGWELNSWSGDNIGHDWNGTLKDLWIWRDLGLALRPLLNWLLYKMVCQTTILSYKAIFFSLVHCPVYFYSFLHKLTEYCFCINLQSPTKVWCWKSNISQFA